ncbi:hypothetical protein [Paraflavitalea pollutisoli]|uniref:hypothetical protein n=1 Tax=Paraflavitalea pollutisoli TaxID=3034143 RepID=UPI0023EC0CFD|nr:hypothetical protein [Paraflavitalea sp. H1-2-19X]
MPGNNRSIGGQEQAGPNIGNDISRNITRETQSDDTTAPVVKNKDKQQQEQAQKDQQRQQQGSNREDDQAH